MDDGAGSPMSTRAGGDRLRRFEGRTVLVTGGGRGIGRAIALGFAAEGGRVHVLGRTEADLDETSNRAHSAGDIVEPHVVDVRNEADVGECVDSIIKADEGIDVLVNSAGVLVIEPSATAATTRLRDVLETNLVGTFVTCTAVGRSMLERGHGRIVNIASLLSFTAFPQRAAYAASKGGVLQLTRVLALEWAPHGVNVNALVPGMIQGEAVHPAVADGLLSTDQILSRIPAARHGTPADVVGPALFLASEDAAYVTGHALVVDGGWLVNGYV